MSDLHILHFQKNQELLQNWFYQFFKTTCIFQYGNGQVFKVLRNSHSKCKRNYYFTPFNLIFKVKKGNNSVKKMAWSKWCNDMRIFICTKKQECKILRNSLIKCKMSCAYKLLWWTDRHTCTDRTKTMSPPWISYNHWCIVQNHWISRISSILF